LQAFADESGPDRVHAAETLGKLGISPEIYFPKISRDAIESDNPALALYSRWAISCADPTLKRNFVDSCLDMVMDTEVDGSLRRIGLFIVGREAKLLADQWLKFLDFSYTLKNKDSGYPYYLFTAFVTCPSSLHKSTKFLTLNQSISSQVAGFGLTLQSGWAMALAEAGSENDIPYLDKLLSEKEPIDEKGSLMEWTDRNAAVSYAILKILNRR
jgi:SSS family solute:Na+ symporter